jgi:hypothetical protein
LSGKNDENRDAPSRILFQLKLQGIIGTYIIARDIGNMRVTLEVPKRSQAGDALALFLGRAFLFLILLFVLCVRLRLLAFPLERDEGEYAYAGQLLLGGFPPYSHAYSMKFPGTYMAYAFFMSAFGQTTQGIHLGLMLINFFTVLLVYYLGKKVIGEFAGIIAAVSYAILSLSFSVLGFAAHATHFVLLPALGGILLLLKASENGRRLTYFLSGALLGISVVMLQTGLFFLLFCVSYIIYHCYAHQSQHWLRKFTVRLGIFSAGALLPLLGIVIWLYFSGVLDRFWFWTITYASAYGSQIPWAGAFDSFTEGLFSVTRTFPVLWVIAAFGFIVMLFRRSPDIKKAFILLFAVFSFLSLCPGFYFREHYFITLLPAVSLCIGIFFDNFGTAYIKIICFGIFAAVIIIGITKHRDYFFRDDPATLSRIIYGTDPYVESVKIAQFIRSESTEADKIVVLGSEPQIYFYSRRLSATGYIYMYSLMENQGHTRAMQNEMIKEIETSKPKFIIFINIRRSWAATEDWSGHLFPRLHNYLRSKYTLVGVVDIISPTITVYKWGNDARKYTIKSRSNVLIFETNFPAVRARSRPWAQRKPLIVTLPSKS